MSNVRLLSGPSAPPKTGGAPKQLIVLLHGVGADGNDLISIAPFYQSVLPHAHIVSPNAPFPFDMAPFGYMWFSIGDLSSFPRLDGVRTAAPFLDAIPRSRTRPPQAERRRPAAWWDSPRAQ